jgi:Beta-lactamase
MFYLLSATKLFTAVAALQCVDRGLVSLDEDVSRILSELEKPKILKGWDDEDNPVLEEAKNEISLRSVSMEQVFIFYLPWRASCKWDAEAEEQDVFEPHKWTRVRLLHSGGAEVSQEHGRGIRICCVVDELRE